MRVLEAVDRAIDSSKQRRLVRDCPCLRASSLLAHRATLRHPGCGHPLDISYSNGHSTTLYESALARLRFSGVLRGERVCLCGGRFREHPRGLPLKSHPSRPQGRAPPGHGGGHGRRPSAPHAGTPGNGGPASTRLAPRRADPRVPGFQFARSPPAPRREPARPTRFPIVRWSVDFASSGAPIVRA